MLNIETKSYPDPVTGDAYKYNADPQKFVEVFNNTIVNFSRLKSRACSSGLHE